MKQLLLLTFFAISFLKANSQQKYYFGTGPGPEKKGAKGQFYSSLQELSRIELSPGDTVFFQAGKIFSGTVSLNNITGGPNQNIVFTSYGKGRSIIDGGNKTVFAITGSKYFKIENLKMIGAGRKAGNTQDGIKLIDCKNAALKNIETSGFQKSGLILYNCEMADVSGVYAHDNGAAGILVEGTYQKRLSNKIHIVDCRADNNPGDPTNLKNHSGNGIVVGNCKNVLIEYCTATNNGWDMPRIGNGPVGIWAYEADSVTIQYCISYRNKTARGAADGGGFDLDGGVTNSVVQYCLSYENWGSGYGVYQYYSASKWFNNTVRYCISINDGNITEQAAAMHIWNGGNGDSTFTGFYAYNNFFYSDTKYAFSFSDQSEHKNFSFFNNIFVASDSSDIFDGVDRSINDSFLGNVWMKKNGKFQQHGFTDMEKWSNSTGYEKYHGKFIGFEPKGRLFTLSKPFNIINPHQLKSNSLLTTLCNTDLRNKGINIKEAFQINPGRTDFFGHTIPLGDGFEPGVCEIK